MKIFLLALINIASSFSKSQHRQMSVSVPAGFLSKSIFFVVLISQFGMKFPGKEECFFFPDIKAGEEIEFEFQVRST